MQSCKMGLDFVIETVITLCLAVYYSVEATLRVLFRYKSSRKDIKNEIVLITGAGGGLGRLMSINFSRLGAILVLVDVNEKGNEETAAEVREYGGKAYAYACDLSSREAVYKLAERVKSEVGDVNILVNNAGVVTGKTLLECPDHLIERCMNVNINAHFWTVKAFLPAMIEANHGHIVSIASSAGLVGVKGLVDYCASKFAAVGFMESLNMELERNHSKIKTTTVCPFFINTGMFDGAKTRFPSILPIQNADESASLIVDAVLRDQVIILLPKILYILTAMKGYLPVKVYLLLNNYFGASSSMDEFVGRGPQQTQQKA